MSLGPKDLERRLQETAAELDRLRLTLEVVGTMDLDAGILNRNGVLEAIERGRRWMERRGDTYGVVVVVLDGMEVATPPEPEDVELLRHLAATFAAGVREVDEVGRVAATTFAAVLQDVRPESVQVVVNRLQRLLQTLIGNTAQAGDRILVGAVEVHTAKLPSPAVLERVIDLARSAEPNQPRLERI